MTERPEDWAVSYRRWLAQGRANVTVYETIEVNHTSFGVPFRLVNRETDLTVDIDGQTGSPVTFTAARFLLEAVPVDGSTEQSAAVNMSALDGRVYAALKTIPLADRANPMTITPRLFLGAATPVQVVVPPSVWNVHSVSVNKDVVRAEMRANPMRVQRIGRYYTAMEFPVLNMLR